jgi:hypothetical protein
MLLKRKMLALDYARKNERSHYEEEEKIGVRQPKQPKPSASGSAISFLGQRQCIF